MVKSNRAKKSAKLNDRVYYDKLKLSRNKKEKVFSRGDDVAVKVFAPKN